MARPGHGRSACRAIFAALAASAAVALLSAPSALAGSAPPHWWIESRAAPTNLPLEGIGVVRVSVDDIGGAAYGEAHEIKFTVTLPAGVEDEFVAAQSEGTPRRFDKKKSKENPNGLACTEPPVEPIVCTFGEKLYPFEQLEAVIAVKTKLHAPAEPVNEVSVTGGGAPPATLRRPLKVTGGPTEFGVENYELIPEGENGEPDTQAGSHPFQLTSLFDLNQRYEFVPNLERSTTTAPALQRNLSFQLPPGLIGDANVVGNPNAVQRCPTVLFGALLNEGINTCPPDTAVGVAAFTYLEPAAALGRRTEAVPIFNLPPAPGEPARFGFEAIGVPVILDTSVRTGGDYGVTVSVKNTSEAAQILGARVTFWGAPEAEEHDEARGWGCLGYEAGGACEEDSGVKEPTPLLTLPTSCTGHPTTTVSGESWPKEENGHVEVHKIGDGPGEASENTTYEFPSELTGCNLLGFSPTLSVEPESHTANTPTGLKMHIHVPQQTTLEVGKLAPSAVKDTTVQFPPGVLLNPAAANGLEACLEGETEVVEGVGKGGVGYTGSRELGEGFEGPVPTFSETLPEPLEPGFNFCANASKVGVVHIKTPDLPNELEGGVYTAAQNANPFGSLFAIYIVAQDPLSKVLVKLAGEVKLNPTTGQITTTFANTPDVPFEELTLELFGGQRATLTTPPTCGEAAKTTASFTPWSGGQPVVAEAPGFDNTSGAEGSACSNPLPFSPSFQAGVSNTQAGAFTHFELTINHPDADQPLTGVTMTLPPGLAAVLASVTPCPEPQASQGTCGPESEIGKAEASVGLGGEPFTQREGKVFLTGPYDRAPFGLTVVVPTKAGPFNFGDVVTRSTIEVDPNTAAVTIKSPLPTTVVTKSYPEGVGVPVQLKELHVTVNREGFQFNPTNCEPMTISGTLTGAQGASESVSSPFHAENCHSLPFKPHLTATVDGQGSKANGIGFNVKITSNGIGEDGIRKVFLTIPAALPSRLTTIQKACPEQTFDANPASCDEGSVIGIGTVHTPVFKNPLTGPAYLVSHGGAEFPDVEFVLQGEGVTIVLDGKTKIKNGVTYSRFESAPDAPFTTFETDLPAGPHSALAVETLKAPNYNVCSQTISMPTEITAQDGDLITETTPVVPTGCSGSGKSSTVVETNSQKLAKALKACKEHKNKQKRAACEKAARKKYGAKTSVKHTGKKSSKKKRK